MPSTLQGSDMGIYHQRPTGHVYQYFFYGVKRVHLDKRRCNNKPTLVDRFKLAYLLEVATEKET